MFSKSLFVSALVIIIGASAAVNDSLLKVEVVVIDDISKLKDLYPRNEFIPIKGVNTKGTNLYTFGARTENDQLVASGADTQTWGSRLDVKLSFKYPQTGEGAVVTFMETTIGQSSNLGDVYIVEGGIGQRHIKLAIEAYGTTFISFDHKIYGIA